MMIAFAICVLLAYDGPRVTPTIPRLPIPWEEVGNRRARRRDRSRK